MYVLIVVVGITIRFMYLFSHDFDYPKRSDVQTFTRFKFIDNFMLIWPGLAILVNFILVRLKDKPTMQDINLK